MKKTGLALAALLTSGALMFTGCTSGTLKKTAMSIGDATVTLGDISVMTSNYAGYMGFDQAKDSMVEQIQTTLKYGAVGKAMGIELDEDDLKSVKQTKAQFAQQGGGLSAYKDFLKKSGSSMDFLDTLFTASAYQSKVMEKLDEEAGDEAEPTDDELKQYFVDHYYRAKHVLVEKAEDAADEDTEDTAAEEATEAASTEPTEAPKSDKTGEALADEILEKAKAGDNFDQLVKDFSTDPGSESNPDGYVFTDGEMVAEFEECVKSLQPGEFGKCESDYGYHIIQKLALSKDDPKFNEWFEEKKDAVKAAMENEKTEQKLNELCEENNITINIDEDVLNAFEEKDMVTPEPTEDTSAQTNN